MSAFGGIVAANRTVTVEMAEPLSAVFTEVVIAPDFEPAALELLTAKKNLRVMSAGAPSPLPFDVRPVDGGLLVQQPDDVAGRSDGVDGRHERRSRPTNSGAISSSRGRCVRR